MEFHLMTIQLYQTHIFSTQMSPLKTQQNSFSFWTQGTNLSMAYIESVTYIEGSEAEEIGQGEFRLERFICSKCRYPGGKAQQDTR